MPAKRKRKRTPTVRPMPALKATVCVMGIAGGIRGVDEDD